MSDNLYQHPSSVFIVDASFKGREERFQYYETAAKAIDDSSPGVTILDYNTDSPTESIPEGVSYIAMSGIVALITPPKGTSPVRENNGYKSFYPLQYFILNLTQIGTDPPAVNSFRLTYGWNFDAFYSDVLNNYFSRNGVGSYNFDFAGALGSAFEGISRVPFIVNAPVTDSLGALVGFVAQDWSNPNETNFFTYTKAGVKSDDILADSSVMIAF